MKTENEGRPQSLVKSGSASESESNDRHLLTMDQISFGYRSVEVFSNLTIQIYRGELVCLLGPSGCGKSTLLRMMAGLIQPQSGLVRWQNQVVPRFGFVFQEPTLLPWATVKDNILLPLEVGTDKLGADDREARLFEVLNLMNLRQYKDFLPHQLSGGLKMRVSLARALISRPEVLLMDEPFAALDEDSRVQLQIELLRLQSDQKLTIVFVTHSLTEAAQISERSLLFSGKRPVTDLHESVCRLGRGSIRSELRLSDRMTERIRELDRARRLVLDTKSVSEPRVDAATDSSQRISR